MNDVIRPTQSLDRFWTEQPVRIGDDADQDKRFSVLSNGFSVLGTHFFIFSANFPRLTTARPTVPRPISCTSSRAVTRKT